jgi:hypothetical protein
MDKQATMRAALKTFQKKLADSTVGYEYPNLEAKPTDPTSPVSNGATNGTGADAADQDHSAAQSELFRQGFEQGYEDARAFSTGLSGIKAVSVSVPATSKDATPAQAKKTKTVGGFPIGHLDQWKKMRTVQFLDANPTSGTTATTTTTTSATSAAASLWDAVLSLLHLRFSAKKAGTGTTEIETIESKLARGWEYLDGLEQGIKAFEATTSVGSVDLLEKWGQQMKIAK